jgi:hypothetical protein
MGVRVKKGFHAYDRSMRRKISVVSYYQVSPPVSVKNFGDQMRTRPTDGTLDAPFLRCVQNVRKLIVLQMLGFWFWYRASL